MVIVLSEMRVRFMVKFYQLVMFLLYFLLWVVVVYMVFVFLSIDLGILNMLILLKFGLELIVWYFEIKFWFVILIIVNLWKYIGYNVVIYLVVIIGIDFEYYEVVLIDGVLKWQQIRYIIILFLLLFVVVFVLFGIGRIFYVDFGFFYQFLMNSGVFFDVINVIDIYVYRIFMGMNDIGMVFVVSFYQLIMGFILVFIFNFIVCRFDLEKVLFQVLGK